MDKLGNQWNGSRSEITVRAGKVALQGTLSLPVNCKSIVLFVHGSGSSRHSSRNKYVANVLNEAGLATLLFDLLTSEEEKVDLLTRHLRFDINLLCERVVATTKWLSQNEQTSNLRIGYFGASTGAAAALSAAARLPDMIFAVVSRGGRPDLSGAELPYVRASTLLIVGENDPLVMGLNEEAFAQLTCIKKLETVPGASHLFEEAGTLEMAALLARKWFKKYL